MDDLESETQRTGVPKSNSKFKRWVFKINGEGGERQNETERNRETWRQREKYRGDRKTGRETKTGGDRDDRGRQRETQQRKKHIFFSISLFWALAILDDACSN